MNMLLTSCDTTEALKWKVIPRVSPNADHKQGGWQNHWSHCHMLMQHLSEKALGHFSWVLSPGISSLRAPKRQLFIMFALTGLTRFSPFGTPQTMQILEKLRSSRGNLRCGKQKKNQSWVSCGHCGVIILLFPSQWEAAWKTVKVNSTLKISLTIKMTD